MRAHTRLVSEGSYCSTLRQRDTEGQCQRHFKDRHSKVSSKNTTTAKTQQNKIETEAVISVFKIRSPGLFSHRHKRLTKWSQDT